MRQENLFLYDEIKDTKVVNVASVPQRSPFRYPGGKTWFVPRLREWLKSQDMKPRILIEPFAGGGIVSLTSVYERLVESALMIELDEDVAAVWEAVTTGNANWLANRILNFEMNHENASKEIVKPTKSIRERAFKTILKNRCNHGGILASGSGFLKKGEAGKGVLSRWYPETLAKRIREIDLHRNRLEFRKEDALFVIEEYMNDPDVVFFIDPPYTAGGKKAGKRLYNYFEVDHEHLFQLCSELEGDFIMTYDNAPEVLALAKKYGFQAKPIPMKNTHHAKLTELVIGRDLGWMLNINRVLENQAKYKVQKLNRARKKSVIDIS
ncbi:DNA methyltransferase [Candidatus Endobugula sertula]|uniref:DNA methyltransferase n=1 Tax=Candidatus Endobugula sertula TaxID=62101 RepID=A0A1D2QN71_9GAMM|nr:DNA methyltransferase [Candidatus Endobugula sertula]